MTEIEIKPGGSSDSREWLETNGIGGFAMGTVAGMNSRRYHGLLTVALRPPLGRVRLLSKFEETLIIDGERFDLSTNQYPGRVYPDGFRYLKNFRVDPFPVWTYQIGGVTLEKHVFMPHGMNAVICSWKGEGVGSVKLELRPLLAFVDYHSMRHEGPADEWSVREAEGSISVEHQSNDATLHLASNASTIEHTPDWYRNFEYPLELERGFDEREDLFQPFAMRFDLSNTATVIASTEMIAVEMAERLEKLEITRRKSLMADASSAFEKQLVQAADQFIVRRGSGYSIIAGYPWFSDWGRDTMIALPGLTLATGRPDIARDILLEFSRHISEGMIPNRFPDEGETADYNTVDATLWHFEAVRAYLAASGDDGLVRNELYEKLAGIVASHLSGTRFGIHVDTDGLLYAGEPGTQLTWMDAKIGDLVITPRIGKPVEIQALWYNALRTMEDLAGCYGYDEDVQRFAAMADLAKLSFNGLFWNPDENCLYDVVENGHRDGSVRPNQLLAISLEHPILDESRWSEVVAKAEAELLTPVGLRSLSPNDPAYVGVYSGSPFERDSAYHQGTVWGWLIGPFIDAYRKTNPEVPDLEKRIRSFLSGFEEHLNQAGLAQISEIFDGDEPHTARGCPAQAWSVSEVLRCLRSTTTK